MTKQKAVKIFKDYSFACSTYHMPQGYDTTMFYKGIEAGWIKKPAY
jgi:hypothetical protein